MSIKLKRMWRNTLHEGLRQYVQKNPFITIFSVAVRTCRWYSRTKRAIVGMGRAMSVSCRIDAASETIFGELHGAVTDKALLDAVQKLYSHPKYCPEYARLVDATRANLASVTGEALRLIAARTSGGRVGRTALVADKDAVYGVLRMFQAYSERVECRVFRQRSEALAWLAEGEPASIAAAAFGSFA
jgi:hypothetical protein